MVLLNPPGEAWCLKAAYSSSALAFAALFLAAKCLIMLFNLSYLGCKRTWSYMIAQIPYSFLFKASVNPKSGCPKVYTSGSSSVARPSWCEACLQSLPPASRSFCCFWLKLSPDISAWKCWRSRSTSTVLRNYNILTACWEISFRFELDSSILTYFFSIYKN